VPPGVPNLSDPGQQPLFERVYRIVRRKAQRPDQNKHRAAQRPVRGCLFIELPCFICLQAKKIAVKTTPDLI